MRLEALVLAAILSGPAAAQDVTIGTAFAYAPFITRDADGAPAGAEPAILSELCARAGWTCSWVEMPFDDLMPALQSGDIDIAANGLGHTPERAALVHLTCPYRPHTDNPPAGTFYVTDPNHDPRSGPIGVTGGSIFEATLRREGLLPVPFPNEDDALEALHNGTVPAHFGSDYYATQTGASDGLIVAGELLTGSRGTAFAVTPTDPALIDAVERHLAALSASGRLAELASLYFGNSLPDPISVCDRADPIS